jgi:hypothetical protein
LISVLAPKTYIERVPLSASIERPVSEEEGKFRNGNVRERSRRKMPSM